MVSNGPTAGAETWDEKDWYRWNRTIRDHFVFNNSTWVRVLREMRFCALRAFEVELVATFEAAPFEAPRSDLRLIQQPARFLPCYSWAD